MDTEQAVTEIATVMKKAGLVWLAWDGRRPVPAWFANVDGQYVVLADSADSAEQPLPGLAAAHTVDVLVPAKPANKRLAAWTATVRRLDPSTEEWATAAQVLRTERLNAADLDTQLDRWRAGADLLVLEPTGEFTDSAHARNEQTRTVSPTGSPAATRGKAPFTLHRRPVRRPKLS